MTVAAAIRAYHLSLSEVGLGRGYEAGDGEGASREPVENRAQYERQLMDLHESYGEAMLELHARKKLIACRFSPRPEPCLAPPPLLL